MATVDILMATYNGERYVREQIESIQTQTFEDWRLLVSDDCSTDNTLAIVEDLAFEDPRIAIASSKTSFGSAKANFIHLLSMTDAPYAMFCDQDDVWLPTKIEKCLLRIKKIEASCNRKTPVLVFSDMKVVNEALELMHASFERSSKFNPRRLSFKHLVALNVAAGCSMLFNRALQQMIVTERDLDGVKMHDWWAMLIASAFGKISYIDEPLNLYRQHANNAVGANEYNPLTRAMDKGFMTREFKATIQQAQSFLTLYGDNLAAKDKESITHYVAVGKSRSFWAGMKHLLASGCWKQGARKVGQIAMVRSLTADKR